MRKILDRLLEQGWWLGAQLLISLVLLGGAVLGFMQMLASAPQAEKAKPAARLAPQVSVEPVVALDGPIRIRVGGVVHPWRELTVAARIGGLVIHKEEGVREGQRVEAGSTLYRIQRALDPVEAKLAVDDAKLAADDARLSLQLIEAELVQLDRQLEELDAQGKNLADLAGLTASAHELAVKERERQERLRQGNAGTEAALDRARQAEIGAARAKVELANRVRANAKSIASLRASRDVMVGRKRRASKGIERALKAVERAELALSEEEVKAPAGGRVMKLMAEQGGVVMRGAGLLMIEDDSQAEVRVSLTAQDLELLWSQPGQAPEASAKLSVPPTPARVLVRVGERSWVWDGTLERVVGDGVDRNTRLVPCLIRVPTAAARLAEGQPPTRGGPPRLLRGLYVQVDVLCETAEPMLVIPARAIRPGGVAYVVDDADKLHVIPVDVVRRVADTVIVRAKPELPVGRRLIVSPLGAAIEGSPVRVVEEARQ